MTDQEHLRLFVIVKLSYVMEELDQQIESQYERNTMQHNLSEHTLTESIDHMGRKPKEDRAETPPPV